MFTYYSPDYFKNINNNRPKIKDLNKKCDDLNNLCIYLEGHFPKYIPKNTYILSKYPFVSYKLVKEFQALRALNKKISMCATSGHWEGDPFLLYTEEDIVITEEDEKFIKEYCY